MTRGSTPSRERCDCPTPVWGQEYTVDPTKHKRPICATCGKPVGMHRVKEMVTAGSTDADIAMSTALVAQYAYLTQLDDEEFNLATAEAKARARRLEVGAKESMLETYDKQMAIADLFYSAMCSIEQQMSRERASGELTDDKAELYLNMLTRAAQAYNTHSSASIRTISQAERVKKITQRDEWAEMIKGNAVDSTSTSPDADE